MSSGKQARQWAHGADMIVGQLEEQGVKQVFGIPGAKIDKVFDSLLDSSIEIIPVRHEANAAFMAAAVGRLTGKAGVDVNHRAAGEDIREEVARDAAALELVQRLVEIPHGGDFI